MADAALVSELPRRSGAVRGIETEGAAPMEERRRAYETVAGPDYLEILEVPVLRGRGFTRLDGAESLPVALVSQSMAQGFWPDDDAVGRRFRTGGSEFALPSLRYSQSEPNIFRLLDSPRSR